MAFHCQCGIEESECSYPNCHNGKRDKAAKDKLAIGVLTACAKDLVSEQPRHDKESLFGALHRLFPAATSDELDVAISEAL